MSSDSSASAKNICNPGNRTASANAKFANTLIWQGTVSAQALDASGAELQPVPEPGTYALMLTGLAAVGFMARRRRA